MGIHRKNQNRLSGTLCALRKRIAAILNEGPNQRRVIYIVIVFLLIYSTLFFTGKENRTVENTSQVAVVQKAESSSHLPVKIKKPSVSKSTKPKQTKRVTEEKDPVKQARDTKKKPLVIVKQPAVKEKSYVVQQVQAPKEQPTVVKVVPQSEPERQNKNIEAITGPTLPNFVKLNNSGNELAVTETEWTCVKDSTNGLVWESKTNNGDLQDMNHSFTWFQTRIDPNDPSSILKSGVADGGRCKGSIACDTQSYVREMNAKKLCGYADWRLPTKAELLTLVMYQNDKAAASIDGQFFPHSVPSWYWTASSNEQREEYAWYVLFRNGIPLNDLKKRPKHIRLVRSISKSPLHNREFAQE